MHHIAITRMARDPATREYIARRRQEDKTKREAIRMLKRYIAREVYRELIAIPALNPAACEP